MNSQLNTLTDFEVAGLNSVFCLADGHAYQDMHPAFQPIIETLPDIWRNATKRSIPDAEKRFNHCYSTFIQSPILQNYEHFRICPTASNTIDIIGTVLKALDLNVVMVEPTFDNLSLLLRRRGVPLTAIQDQLLFEAAEADQIATLFPEPHTIGALFIVNPNNPTGLSLTESGFKNIIKFCETHRILLVIDHCFRVYKRQPFDDYELLINSSLSFMAFEDTGKVWPTQDLKASLVYFSKDLAPLFNEIYNEVYLCVSNFSLEILSTFFMATLKSGIQTTIWEILDKRRMMLRDVLKDSVLRVPDVSIHSQLPVEWIEITDQRINDFDLCRTLRQNHLALLPGRQFYWNSPQQLNHQRYVRVSFMKTERIFLSGLNILSDYCDQTRFEMNQHLQTA